MFCLGLGLYIPMRRRTACVLHIVHKFYYRYY